MVKCCIGVLLIIEWDIGMGDYIEIGIFLNVKVSFELLINIFILNILFYDGVVIMKNNEIVVVVCYLLFLESLFILKELGMWYRVVVGISEVIDSLMIIVFEEIGGVSVVKNGDFYRELMEEVLKEMFEVEFKKNIRDIFFNCWYWRGKKNG